MKKTLLLVMLLICMLCVCATAEEGQIQENDNQITMEYMLGHSELTEADFEGIDFDDFAAYFELTPEVLEEFDGVSLLSLYKIQLEMAEGTDYTEIYREASGKLREDNIGHITAVIWKLHQGMDNEWMVVDFEKKAVYGGVGFGPECCLDKDQLKDLTEEDALFIGETAAKAGMTGWDNLYIGNGEWSYDGNEAWMIGIRLDSGECVKYEGTGFAEDGMPESPGVTFCRTIWDRFHEKAKPKK